MNKEQEKRERERERERERMQNEIRTNFFGLTSKLAIWIRTCFRWVFQVTYLKTCLKYFYLFILSVAFKLVPSLGAGRFFEYLQKFA
jgi:hypothetical protein